MANTSKGVLFPPPSDAYVRSCLYLLYTLIKLYYTKALAIKPRLWPQIESFSSGGQESWHLCMVQQQHFTSQFHLAVSQSWCILLAPTQCPAVRSDQSRKFCSLSLQLIRCLWALLLESSKVESKVPTRRQRTPKPGKHLR